MRRPGPPRSLRGRLLLTLLTVVCLVLVGVAAFVYATMRAYLVERADTTVRAVHARMVEQIRTGRPPGEGMAAGARMLGTTTYYIEIHEPSGRVRPLAPGLRDPEISPPRIPSSPRLTQGSPVTVTSADGEGPDYRMLVRRLPGDRGRLVVAVPLTEVDSALRRLRVVESAAVGAGLLVTVAAGFVIVRRGLRPLEAMARDADAIALGHGPARITGSGDSEVGRLGTALNTMLQKQGEAFTQQQHMQDRLRRFVADASHELRTPISAVLGYADLYRQGALPDEARRTQVMGRITDEALRMQRMVDDLLLLARLDAEAEPRRAPVDISAVARAAVEASRVVAPDRPLELLTEGPATMIGDADQLRRLLDNLLANVRAHTPAGTPARVRTVRTGGTVLVEVADQGDGIPPQVLPFVFDRFHRGASAAGGKGSGLGLAIVAAVAAAHRGRPLVRSGPGLGTTVTVELPAAVGPEATSTSGDSASDR
ncbi:HAMP domain-containing histidine kinase [Streptomyces sp. NA04227]|uniref:sensor histidine kinase n=1 Tax=Streptomyces sp. NA04227 TaxID=2742136 RepID=UPI001590BF46|nr:HAMP domain-containing sensor histidine kinase [Streptomyces sp. NA04227]QKW08359.1 HAMP domain-containing histidine kinase [Streptomyces sp. NA04227]